MSANVIEGFGKSWCLFSTLGLNILKPGEIPVIETVTQFPAHEYISGGSKIPTVIYYDQAGKVRAVGAEAMREGIYEVAEDHQWLKAEGFKLHLRSEKRKNARLRDEIPPLPLNKTVVDVLADFMRYLLNCSASYIKETHANGTDLWQSVKGGIDFVLSHPNGWEGVEQSQMRKAAVMAGLIPDNAKGHTRLSFVTEGEANLHFAMHSGLPANVMSNGNSVGIVDAGKDTIDIHFYDSEGEVSPSQCHFHGSVFVSIYAQSFLEQYLKDSKFIDDLDHIVRMFSRSTMPRFRSDEEMQYIQFGSSRDNQASHNIRFGQLKLQGSDVALFFQPSIDCIVNAILEQVHVQSKPISHVVLVGEFSANDWLFEKVKTALVPHDLTVFRPESHVNKAVSEGALLFYLHHLVPGPTRVSELTYGHFCHIPFNPNDPDHQQRSNEAFVSMGGQKQINDSFHVILPKNTRVSATKEFRRSFFRQAKSENEFDNASFSLWYYRGSLPEPKWKDEDTDNYRELGIIKVDLSELPLQSRPMARGKGRYYQLDYDIVVLFGLTELKAFVSWKEDGLEKRSATKIVHDLDPQ
ncbi:hypothetical protein BJ165DRAFT_1527104 [Panaeolus papilionaceus]|nr:hypothetical protein BJ165DRAFT_1527104 [Panaeolus papilionaceus]